MIVEKNRGWSFIYVVEKGCAEVVLDYARKTTDIEFKKINETYEKTKRKKKGSLFASNGCVEGLWHGALRDTFAEDSQKFCLSF